MATRNKKQENPIEEALMRAREIKAAAQENALSFLEEKVLRKSVSNRIAESIFREEEEEEIVDSPELEDDLVSEEEADEFLLDSEPEEVTEEDEEEDLPLEDEEELDEDLYLDDEGLDGFEDDEFMAGEDDSLVDDFDSEDMTLYDTDLTDEPVLDDVEDPLDSSFEDDIYEEDDEDMVMEEESDDEEDSEETEEDDEEESEKVEESRIRKLKIENRKLRRKVYELSKANRILNRSINEVTLYNNKLAYSTHFINKNKNLTLAQKKKVVEQFSKAKSINQVKSIYKALVEGAKKFGKKSKIKESKKRVSYSNPFKANPMLKRETPKGNVIVEKVSNKYAKLAGLKD